MPDCDDAIAADACFDLRALLDKQDLPPLAMIDKFINPSYAKVLRITGFDVSYARGQGQYLWDKAGQRYLDCLSGFGQFAVGRNHPVVREALKQAMDMDLPCLPKFGPTPLSGLLARELLALAPGELDTAYFCNSGAEGCETAMKYARAATGRERIVYCQKGYHGLTMGALSCCGGQEFREGFGSLLAQTTAVPFNDLKSLQHELGKGDVAGFLVEPIQGKGVNMPDEGYLQEAAGLCRKHGTLFIADEVQTGLGRTGKMFACEHWGIEPDILVLSKALSGGYVPVAAVLSKRWIHQKVFSSLDRCVVHSTTFGSHAMAMAAGLATLHVLRQEKLVDNAATLGEQLIRRLAALVPKYELLKSVRGKGLMVAIEFGAPRSLALKMGWSLLHKVDAGLFPQAVLMPLIKDHRILAQVAGHHQDVIKLLPSLVITQGDVDDLVGALETTIAACHKFPGPAWEIGKRLATQAMKQKESNG